MHEMGAPTPPPPPHPFDRIPLLRIVRLLLYLCVGAAGCIVPGTRRPERQSGGSPQHPVYAAPGRHQAGEFAPAEVLATCYPTIFVLWR